MVVILSEVNWIADAPCPFMLCYRMHAEQVGEGWGLASYDIICISCSSDVGEHPWLAYYLFRLCRLIDNTQGPHGRRSPRGRVAEVPRWASGTYTKYTVFTRKLV
jgi:hypothetical protein